jgi:hypothetical protein
MGRIKNNVLTRGFSGKFGEDLVFRQVNNKTFFARKSVSTKKPTLQQVNMRNRFAEASFFASVAMDKPTLLDDYTQIAELQGLKSAYVAAVTDHLTMPEIEKVFANFYTGKAGDMINIEPKTAFKIVDIDVTILAPDNTVLESGKAVPTFLRFRYIAAVANANVQGSKIVLVARDRHGKEQSLGVELI